MDREIEKNISTMDIPYDNEYDCFFIVVSFKMKTLIKDGLINGKNLLISRVISKKYH